MAAALGDRAHRRRAVARRTRPSWPDGRAFAFTIVDDTDGATVENVKPVYDLLGDLGIRTTKLVWPLAHRPADRAPITTRASRSSREFPSSTLVGGQTLEDTDYRRWIQELSEAGFEVGIHGIADGSSCRTTVARGLEYFRECLGHPPRVHANHVGQREGLYWGSARVGGATGRLYRAIQAIRRRDSEYFGAEENSPYFWGDLAREHITYVRNFTFPGVDTLAHDPLMPYHDPAKPYVKWWFSGSEGPDVSAFNALLSEPNQDVLQQSGGACIVYTHFAAGFCVDGRVDRRFAQLMRRLAGLDGWLVPASPLLDHLRSQPGRPSDASNQYLRRVERDWLAHRVRRESS